MASAYDSDEAFERLMDDLQVIYALKAGVALTEEQVAAIQRFEQHTRDEEEGVTEAFHRGHQTGLQVAGGTDVQTLQNKLEAKISELTTERALRRFDQHREFRRGAQACREMMARFVEQGGDAITAASIRANWHPGWGEDPGAPEENAAAPTPTGETP